MSGQIRLDKFLADAGKGTRSEVKQAIQKGRVFVNGQLEKKPERKVEPDADEIILDGRQVSYEKHVYFMMNKPQGVVSATEDSRDATVVGLLDAKDRKGVFPVGRLDKDTEGLLLLTNDGELAHRLLSPKKHVPKCYYAKVDGFVTEEDRQRIAGGIQISEDFTALPGKLEILSHTEGTSEILLTIYEGKFHQVKRMMKACGKEVLYLKRVKMGGLMLDEGLNPGEYRRLSKEELQRLENLDKFSCRQGV